MCGEDDTKRAVYNMKESIEEGNQNIKIKDKEYSEESLKKRRTELVSKEKLIVISVLIHL